VAKHAIWRAGQLREHALTAGRLVTSEKAERRVIVLENPALRGRSQIRTSLYAGVQLNLPGEVAPTHRHKLRRSV
jgi:gentisate 1,2-dioxygenase